MPNRNDRHDRPCFDMINVLSRTLASANRMIATLLSEEGIDNLVPSHGDILMQLFANRELSMAALADAIGKDPSTVTALVKKLADAGYVETRKCAQDKRVTNVGLTEKGRGLEKSVANISNALFDAMETNLSPDQLRDTRNALLTMKERFEKGSAR